MNLVHCIISRHFTCDKNFMYSFVITSHRIRRHYRRLIIINDSVYGAVLLTAVTARVHPVHSMNADWAPGGPPALRPSQPTRAVSPPINGCYHPHPPSPFVTITQPESWYSFTVPRRVEGWVDLRTAGRVRSPCPRLYIAVAVVINITGRGLSHRSQSCHR